MSTVAPVLDYDSQPADTLRQEMALDVGGGGLVGWLRSHFWALNDQALISATNFTTLVLTARALNDKAEFGRFSIIYSILLFCNILQSTLITQAHNVLGTARSGLAYRRYTSSTGLGQLVLIALVALLAMPFAAASSWSGSALAPLLWALLPSIVAWQLQEFVRRVLYTEGRYGAAFFNDIISYGGQTVVLAALYVAGRSWGYTLTGSMALYVLAATSALAAVVGLWQLRHSLTLDAHWSDLHENWHFGKWLLGGELMQWASSLQMQILWAALLLSMSASADLRAVQILFGPTRVIAFFLGTVLPIRFARTLHTRGMGAMRGQIRSVYFVLVPLVGTYCLLMGLFPRTLLRLLYGNDYAVTDTVSILILYSINAFLGYMQMVMTAALTAGRRTRSIFAGSAWGCAVALIMSPLCIHYMGINGAIVSIIVTTLLVTALFIAAYRKSIAEENRGQAMLTAVGRDVAAAPLSFPVPTDGDLDARAALLQRVLTVFDAADVPYCILHGHQSLPHEVTSDVDMLVAREMIPQRLAELLRSSRNRIGADLVQWFSDSAHFIVLASRGTQNEPPALLQLHVSTDYQVSDRVVFSGEEILRTRRRSENGLWIPSAGAEFTCVLANRLDKAKLDDARGQILSALWEEDTQGCREHLSRIFPAREAALVADAAESGDWTPLLNAVRSMGATMRRRLSGREPLATLSRRAQRQLRRLVRWSSPQCGMHLVFLGPDGVGKSTVIDAVQECITPAFLHTHYQTFARGILPTRPKPTPHALPPRSWPESMVKAAWWFLCYGPGYMGAVHPTLARGGLAINHRYLIDAVVDPHRYRYAGPARLIRWIWQIVPKPDLIIFLDAPVEVICRRKQEVPAEQLAKLREGYLALAATLPNAHVVTTDQSLDATVNDVTRIILEYLARRIAARPSLA